PCLSNNKQSGGQLYRCQVCAQTLCERRGEQRPPILKVCNRQHGGRTGNEFRPALRARITDRLRTHLNLFSVDSYISAVPDRCPPRSILLHQSTTAPELDPWRATN